MISVFNKKILFIFLFFFSFFYFFISKIPVSIAYASEVYTDSSAIEAAKKRGYDNFISISHRGYSKYAPENTMPAFELSVANGFKYIETDIMFTLDGVAVLSHDDSINRTARLPNGAIIPDAICLSDITYAQALEYDYGSWFNDQFTGTKLVSFEEFISFCKKNNVTPVIELKRSKAYSEERIKGLYETVKKYGLENKTFWIGFFTEIDSLQIIKNLSPSAHFIISADETTLTYHHSTYYDFIKLVSDWKTQQNTVYAGTDFRYLSKENNEIAIDNGVPIIAWIVNDETTMMSLKNHTAGIMSDYLNPDLIWSKNNDFEFLIDYELYGGIADGNPKTYYENSNSFTLINPTKNGYTFLGWIGSGISGISSSVTIPKGTIGDLHFEAIWDKELQQSASAFDEPIIMTDTISISSSPNMNTNENKQIKKSNEANKTVMLITLVIIADVILTVTIVLIIINKRKKHKN